jgi:hypothetical protein
MHLWEEKDGMMTVRAMIQEKIDLSSYYFETLQELQSSVWKYGIYLLQCRDVETYV